MDQSIAKTLLDLEVKKIKLSLLQGHPLNDPWANVWVLNDTDHGIPIEAGPTDIFILNLIEHGSSGYLWNIDDLGDFGFNVIASQIDSPESIIGSLESREWIVSNEHPVKGEVVLQEKRPWSPDEHLNEFNFTFDLLGKEEGYPRYERELYEAA